MDKLLSACALHSELILHLFKHYLVSPLARVSEICVMKSRVRVYFACVCLCVSVLNFIYATFYPLIFYAKFLLACSTCLLCTTFVFTSCFSIILRPIICSYETKLNFFLLYYSVFVYIRLEDCCCCLVFLFSLQRAMCTADVIWLRARVSVSVYWWARVPTLMRGGGACVCEWGCLNSCFCLFCFGKKGLTSIITYDM